MVRVCLFIIWVFIGLWVPFARSQTTSVASARDAFCIHIRSLKPADTNGSNRDRLLLQRDVGHVTGGGGIELHYDSIEAIGSRVKLVKPDVVEMGPVSKFLDRTFTPEVVHFRKVEISSSVYTAIKRKNPLCLLNPLFFQVTW